MPISASAKKSLRVALRQKAENQTMKARYKSAIKSATVETLSKSISLIDKAAKNNVINKNKAARLKSQVSKKVNNLESAPVKVVAKKTTTAKAKPKAKAKAKK